MAEQFHHGVELIEVNSGTRPIQTVASSVIGITGTAEDADPELFPLNTPVLFAGEETEKLAALGSDGTLPPALGSVFGQAGAAVVVVRVEEGETDGETLANVIGGVDSNTGQYEGLRAMLAAESIVHVKPRILIAPGFTHTRRAGAVSNVAVTAPGSGYATPPTVSFTGGSGSGAAAVAVLGTGIDAGKVVAINITNPGSGYVSAPTVGLTGGGGTGATATASYGTIGNAVVAELLGIANKLRAVIVADGPNTNDAAALAYAGDFGSRRVYVVDPKALKTDAAGVPQGQWSSALAAGLIAQTDNELGFWHSPSNRTINGIVGTARPIDFAMDDPTCRANLLNAGKVATIVRQDGYRMWGNRTLSSDPKWAFLSVGRTADIINESIIRAVRWAIDRNITKSFFKDVSESVNDYMRYLIGIGAILGGECWADPSANSPSQVAQGSACFDFDFTPPTPAEKIRFRSQFTQRYFKELF